MNETAIKIVPATPDDVRGIQEVFHKTWLATYPNEEARITRDDIEDRFKDAYSEERMAKRRENIEKISSDGIFLVAKENEKVAGLCRASRTADRNLLNAIYILPEYQGKGIGMKLWNAVQSFFNSSKDTYVEVATYNTNAIGFYKRLGFSDTGRRFTDPKFVMKSGSNIPQMEMILKA